MTYKKVILPQLLDSISKEISLNPDKMSGGTIVNNRKNTNNRNKYKSKDYYQNQHREIERCIDLGEKGYIVIRSANPSSFLHHVTLHQKIDSQEKFEELAALDSELLSITNACCTIIRYKDKEYSKKGIDDFCFEIKVNWTYQKGKLDKTNTQVKIEAIHQREKDEDKKDKKELDFIIDDSISFMNALYQGFGFNKLIANYSTGWSWSSDFNLDQLFLQRSNTITVKKNKDTLKVEAEFFKGLNEKANGITTVEEAILSGREKEFISIFEMEAF